MSRPTISALSPGARKFRLGVLAVLMAAAAALAFAAHRVAEPGSSRELSGACEEVEPCLELEAEAERRLAQCWGLCRQESMDHELARILRYRAEERALVRDHYQKRDAAEQAVARAAAEQKLAQWQREHAAREQSSAREHERRLELERLRQEQVDRALARERTRRLAYLGLLGADGRKDRLRRCHAKSAVCEQLVFDLVESTADLAEQRSLADLHERLLGGKGERPALKPEPKAAPPAAHEAETAPAAIAPFPLPASSRALGAGVSESGGEAL